MSRNFHSSILSNLTKVPRTFCSSPSAAASQRKELFFYISAFVFQIYRKRLGIDQRNIKNVGKIWTHVA